MRFSIASMAALAVAVSASPVDSSMPTQTTSIGVPSDAAEIRSKLDLGVAHGGAEDLPKPTAPPSVNNKMANGGPDYWTINLVNIDDYDIATVHVDGYKSPTPRGGDIAPGIVQKFNDSQFEIPKGYHGNIAYNKDGYSVTTGDESQIEFSYVDQYNNGNYIFDINISYVNGFTLPAICVCGKWYHEEYTHLTGSSKDLFALGSCPDNNGQGACRNPQRKKRGDVGATPFFQPAHFPGGPYTYPDDNLANNMNGDCTTGLIHCCIGTNCGGLDTGPK